MGLPLLVVAMALTLAFTLSAVGIIGHVKHSREESSRSMIFTQRGLRSKTLTAQINEALCKVLCHDLCVVIQSMHELNITPEFTNVAA